MPSESGDSKLLGNFSKLIELISTSADYNPANAKLKIPALNTQNAASQAVLGSVGTNEANYKFAVNARQFGIEALRPVVPRVGNMLKASGADKKIQDDFNTHKRKITGARKGTKPKDDANTPQNEANKAHSVSQQSYENIRGNFNDLIALVATVTSYQPNEPELTIVGLQARAADIAAKDAAVNTTFASRSAARGLRDQLLYTNDDSIVNIALLVKAYVRASQGPDSQLFKQLRGIKFERQGKKPKNF